MNTLFMLSKILLLTLIAFCVFIQSVNAKKLVKINKDDCQQRFLSLNKNYDLFGIIAIVENQVFIYSQSNLNKERTLI